MISIVTPTYNEKDNISLFINKISAYCKKLDKDYEIIVVDDDSPDGTSAIVKNIAKKDPHVILITRINKSGIGSAYHVGYKNARGSIIVGIDADMSQSLSSIPKFIKRLDAGYDMVIGSRYLPQSRVVGIPLSKQLGGRLFNVALRFILGYPTIDSTHSYRAMTRSSFKKISKYLTEDNHPSFFIELTFWEHKLDYKIIDVPTLFRKRKYGYSKLNIVKGLREALFTIVRLVLK